MYKLRKLLAQSLFLLLIFVLPVHAKALRAKLVAVGDIMMHETQMKAGFNPQTGGYSFDTYFTEVVDIFKSGDWVVGNLETPVAGKDLKYTGYPQFNAPTEFLDTIRDAGFQILSTANNHSMDRRAEGVARTLRNIKSRGLHPIGTFENPDDVKKILTLEKNGIKMAFLAYTYGTNGIFPSKGKEYVVNVIDEKKMVSDILQAKQEGADVVTLCLHFGIEYQRQPNAEQKILARNLIRAGADIILGSHTHVVQPYEYIAVEEEGKPARKGLVIYSLGNFISNQTGNFTDYGLILTVDVQKNVGTNGVEIVNMETIPTYVHRFILDGKRIFRVLALPNLMQSRKDPYLSKEEYSLLEQRLKELNRHIASIANHRIGKLK